MALKVGNVLFKGFKKKTTYCTNAWYADVLVGGDKLYLLAGSMNTIYVYEKTPDGIPGAFLYTRNWVSNDSIITEICRSSSSVPSAYAMYVLDGVDYLVGWSHDSSRIIEWELDSNGTISPTKRTYHPYQPITMVSYSRGGWDGDTTLYFRNYSSSLMYKWDLVKKGVATLVNPIAQPSSMNSSYTGSGLLVDKDFVYWGAGANQGEGYIGYSKLSGAAVSAFNYTHFNNASNLADTPGNLPTAGTIQLTALHPDICYLISSSFTGFYIMDIESAFGQLGFTGELGLLKEFQPDTEYYSTDDVELAWTDLQLVPDRLVPLPTTVTATSQGKGGETYEDGVIYKAIIDKSKVTKDIVLREVNV